MYVLGISCFYHDAAAALIKDGQLVCASQEERFSRIKHDFGYPEKAIAFCLRTANITIDDVDLVVFYEKPFQKFDRILLSALATWPRSAIAFRESTLVWLLDKLWTRDTLQERLGCSRDKIVFCRHHVAHACSAYYPSGFDHAALLTVDGVGEWSCGSRGSAWDFTVEVSEEMRYPHSLGLLYSAFTAFLGFQVNEGEYKVMGMAPYGKPTFVNTIFENLVDLHEDGSFRLNMEYFAYHHSAYHSFTEKFTALFGKPRTKEESNLLDPHYADVAASIQRATEIILVRQASYLHKKYGHENLCMAGGSALNSVANAKIFQQAGFKNIYIQPAAGDDGGALGAALWGYHNVLNGRNRFKMTHCYWGEEHSDAAVKEFLQSQGHSFKEYADEQELFRNVVARLTHGQVVGWMQGRFEWGPRALGHRSILADPRFARMKDVVNARIKFREPFRPFAPSVLADRVEDFFELPNAEHVDPARFMLMVVPVKPERRADVPAITHEDGTARIQAVHRQDNPRYYDLIKAFGEETGVPVILNTSFNLRGEAIVNTPAEAYSTFERSDMDALVMGNIVVCRREVDDQRQLSAHELEMWSHTPSAAQESGATATSAEDLGAQLARKASENHRRYLAQIAKQQASSQLGPVGNTVQALLIIVGVLLILEIIARCCFNLPNMQMRGIYSLREVSEGEKAPVTLALTEAEDLGEPVVLTPNWKGRIHSGEFDARINLDAHGHRPVLTPGTELDSSRAVLALGDSFTFGCWQNEDATWLSDVQRSLKAPVTNASRPNAGTIDALVIAQRELNRQFYKQVVLGFYTGNDYYDNMVGPAAFTVQSGALVLTREAAGRWENYNCLDTDSNVLDQEPKLAAWRPAFLRRLYIYQLAMGLCGSSRYIVSPSEAPAWLLRSYTRDMEVGVARTQEALLSLHELCEKAGAQLNVVIIPSAPEIYPEDCQKWCTYHEVDLDKLDTTKARAWISTWCMANDVPCLDLYGTFAGLRRLYYQGDMHWNSLGHLSAGQAVSQFLQRQNESRQEVQ